MSEFQDVPAAASSRTGSSHTWIWVLLGGLVVGVLSCGGICAGLVVWGVGRVNETVQDTEPFQLAMKRLEANPEVKERLGAPLENPRLSLFNINTNDRSGSAEFRFTIRGPKGKATVYTTAKRTDGDWKMTELKVTFDDGHVITEW